MGGFGCRCEIWVHWYTNLIVYIFFEAGFAQTLGAAESLAKCGFRQKQIVSTKGEISPDPRGGRILELTSQIVFGCVLTKVLWFKCVENMV